ncbi:MAG: hypothetical protein LBQ66_01655, partial [Planctomycetaceae bacterium]|nr:hypothetical protein [Planctomycetaceae bacterium]
MSTNLEAEVVRNRSRFTRRVVWYIVLILLSILFLVFLYFCLVPSRLIISPETTLITKLNANGKPDYVGAFLLEHNGQLTNPDDNGLRMVIEKFGPHVLEDATHIENYVWEDLPKDKTYKGAWYRKEWIPFCNAMSIDPTKKPVEYKSIREKLEEIENSKYNNHRYLAQLTDEPWRAEDHPEAAKFVEESAEALAVYAAAAKKPQWICYRKQSDSLANIHLIDLAFTHGACRDFLIRANERISRNDIAGAFDDAVSILRIGRHVQKGSVTIERSSGIRDEMYGINVIQSILTHCNPNAEQIRQFINELEKLPKPIHIPDKTMLFEEMMILDSLFNTRNNDLYNSLVFNSRSPYETSIFYLLTKLPIDYNIATKRIRTNFKQFEELSKENDTKKRMQFYFKFDDDIKHLHEIILNPSEELIRVPLITNRSILLADCMFYYCFAAHFRYELFNEARMEVQRDLLRVSLALELYQRENGHYPDKLESIAPKYIDAIPEDPFTSKELTYKKIDNGYILYSFGQNK